ncbi:phospholipase D family protein [Pseudoroseomonas wenyumeiae]|uniref:Phospholipase D n=1 Tax=Teichococcus wenyumeiae TaxID=2478470 RepID=A0A3A9JDQ3_9PROT|nr:phospholipase D family protein [Pseudoroseomonas wenyumeiae]RKK02695.1 phospholipase D family protein [Pseudoroseomonas wenyumeiae]RMI26665.1 phospholipase D family protein [Pseudoroseomonas wenyumeiae]
MSIALDPPIAVAPVQAGAAPGDSALDRLVAKALAAAGNGQGARTGIALVPLGLEAFMVRASLARAAGRTLDLQYYTWMEDTTGRLMAREALHAADRGVRVRLLLDDSYALSGEALLATLAAHPRVEVRLFNTRRFRFLGQVGLALEFALGGWHLNHRMHNKCWVADGKVAVVGGRNISDNYFDAAGDFNFRDLDVIIAGEAAAQAQAVFDSYWSSSLALPVEHFRAGRDLSPEALETVRARLEDTPREDQARPYLQELAKSRASFSHVELLAADDAVRVLADPPAKAKGRGVTGCMAPAVGEALMSAQREALVVSPYFVPGEGGMAMFEALVKRGVKVTVVTNSLAATDVVAVHAGYARYRPRLLELGVTLFELKRTTKRNGGVFGSKGASLHTKALAIDGEMVFVGSFNLDPRSARLNTEMGAFVHHSELARQVHDEHRRLTEPDRSYRVWVQGRKMLWTDDESTSPHEPEAPLARRMLARAVEWLPVEAQL